MKSKISKVVSGVGFALLAPFMPVIASNTTLFSDTGFFDKLFAFLRRMMGYLFPIVSAALILLFGYQLIMFLWGSKEDVEDHEKFRKRMINSFIAVLMWFILFGLINTVADAIGVKVGDNVEVGDTTHVCLDPTGNDPSCQ